MEFSIIIPCYNSYKFMKNCLENFENQTYKDFELVIIDDCSLDTSYEDLLKYKENSKLNIKLIKNEKNLGAGNTRNVGLENAEGKYVFFVDADDYIKIDALEKLYNVLKENPECDCILFDYIFKSEKNEFYQKTISKNISGNISKKEALIYSSGSVCGKLYKLENLKINKIDFPNFKRNEDMPFNKIAIANSSNIYYLNEALYYYIKNESSSMNNISILNYDNAQNAMNLIEEKLKEKYPYETEGIFIVEFLYSSTMTLVEKKEKRKIIIDHIRKCEEKYPKLYENEVINDLPKHQKMFVKNIQKRRIFVLRSLEFLRKLVKKYR